MAATALPRSDSSALARFLAAASGAKAVEISGLELLAGGAIQENWGLDAEFAGGHLAGTQRLVLRTDAPTGIPSSLGRIEEFAVLKAAFAARVSVPEPLWACPDPSVFGKAFFVMRRVAGTAQGRQITGDPALEADLPAVAARLAQELARIQTIRPPRPDLGFLRSIGAVEHIASFRGYLDRHPQPRPVLEWAARWLETHLPEPAAPVLCHRDFRTGNYMLDGAELTATLDWEFAGWGDPDEDIGWFCCKGWRFARLDREAGGIAARAVFYREYEAASGRHLDPDRVRFWEVLANLRWAVIALQQSDRVLIGGARDLSTAIIGRRASECELELLMLLDGDGPLASLPAGKMQAVPIRDLPSGAALLALGRDLLLGELLPVVPPERQRELRLVATAIAIAEREAIAGDAPARDILERLVEFYDDVKDGVQEAPTPTLPRKQGRELAEFAPTTLPRLRGREGHAPQAWEGGGCGSGLPELLQRFAGDLRRGAFEGCDMRGRAANAILWRLTVLKLREGNPQFLAENGSGE
jgi:aminoglycoside phosphotransferase (APT) family kinase protein